MHEQYGTIEQATLVVNSILFYADRSQTLYIGMVIVGPENSFPLCKNKIFNCISHGCGRG
jgi:hypothetical protein